MADASIYSLIRRPEPSPGPIAEYGQVLQLRHLMDQGELNAMQRTQLKRSMDEDERVSQFYAGLQPGDDPRTKIGDLLKVSPKAGMAAQKYYLEADKTKAEADKARADLAAKNAELRRNSLVAVNDQPAYDQWLEDGARLHGPDAVRGLPREFTPDLKMRLMSTADKLLDQLKPDWRSVAAGGSTVMRQMNPNAPGFSAEPVAHTQTPDSVASIAAQAQQGDLNRGVTVRGQNLTDARARDQLAAGGRTFDTERGVVVNTRDGTATPVTTAGQPLAPKLSEGQKKELSSIDAQAGTVKGALDAVKKTPDAFSFSRGTATMAGGIPESIAGRMDTSEQRQARSYVFNVVSKVINERAGAAQSAQELARLRSFLPAETDNAKQIEDKLTAFQTYLGEQRQAWERPQPSAPAAPKQARPATPELGARVDGYIFKGGNPADPKSWEKAR